MGLFKNKTKITSITEQSNSDIKTSRIVVLGACCKKSLTTYSNVKIAVKELNISEEPINLGDVIDIAKYGVMSTPALVIDNKVVAMGTLLTVDDAKRLILEHLK